MQMACFLPNALPVSPPTREPKTSPKPTTIAEMSQLTIFISNLHFKGQLTRCGCLLQGHLNSLLASLAGEDQGGEEAMLRAINAWAKGGTQASDYL